MIQGEGGKEGKAGAAGPRGDPGISGPPGPTGKGKDGPDVRPPLLYLISMTCKNCVCVPHSLTHIQ